MKTIKKVILTVFILSFLFKEIYATYGAQYIGHNSYTSSALTTTASITLPSGRIYFCAAAASGGVTITPSSGWNTQRSVTGAWIGFSVTNNICSVTTSGNSYITLGGISLYNYTAFNVLNGNALTGQTATTQTISFNLNRLADVVILASLASSANNRNGYISSISNLPPGCTAYVDVDSLTYSSVVVIYCRNLSAGSYSITFNIVRRAPATYSFAFEVYEFPIFLFSITPNQSNINLIPGQSSMISLNINVTNGNPLPVNLSCSTSDSNLGCSLSQTQVTPDAIVNLQLTSNYNLAPGTYTVIVNGIAENNATAQAVITVNVPQESISISANPSVVRVMVGSSNSTTITASTNYGYNLQLTCINLPAGISCSFNPQTISSGGSSTLTIFSSNTTSPGDTILTIRATDVNTGNYNEYNLSLIIDGYVYVNVNNPFGATWRISSSLESISGSNSVNNQLIRINRGFDTLNAQILSNPLGYSCSISPSSTSVSHGNSYTFTVSCNLSEDPVNVTSITPLTVNAYQGNMNILLGKLNISILQSANINLQLTCNSQIPCWFNQSTFTSSGVAEVYVNISPTIPIGSYTITINASYTGDFYGYKTVTYTLYVNRPFDFILPSSLDIYIGSLNSTNINVIKYDPTINLISFSCTSPNINLLCSLNPSSVSDNSTISLTITANQGLNEGSYVINITGISNTNVQITKSIIVNVRSVKVYFIDPTPPNNANLNYIYLPIAFYTTVSNVILEINNQNYTIFAKPNSNNLIELYYNYSNPSGLPTLYNLIGNVGGNVRFRLYAIGPTINLTEERTIYIPPLQYQVNYIDPTPPNNYVTNIWLLQIKGEIIDNTLSKNDCYLELLNPNTSSWDSIKIDKCEAIIYNDNLKIYGRDIGNYYEIKYRLRINSSQGLTYTAPERTLYVDKAAKYVEVISPDMKSYEIQSKIIDSVVSGIPYVVFVAGSYKVNLIIDINESSIILLGYNTVLEPLSVGSPIITVKSGNVVIEGFNMNSRLFALRIDGGNVTIRNVNINSNLYGIQTNKNATVAIENSNIYGKVGGIYASAGIGNSIIFSSRISSDIWGIYLKDAYNIQVKNSSILARVFGINIEGNSSNILIENVNVEAKIFGIYIKEGSNIYVRNSIVDSEIFGLKIDVGNNYIENTTIYAKKVFGIYILQPNNLNNITIYGGIFGAYLTGNGNNIKIFGSRLGINLFGSGRINDLSLDSARFNIEYAGSSIIRSSNKAPETLLGFVFGENQFELLGDLNANITFITNIASNRFRIAKIIGSRGSFIANDTLTFQPSGYGIYALYYS